MILLEMRSAKNKDEKKKERMTITYDDPLYFTVKFYADQHNKLDEHYEEQDKHQEGLEVWKQFIKLAPESEEAKLIKSQIDAIEAGQG